MSQTPESLVSRTLRTVTIVAGGVAVPSLAASGAVRAQSTVLDATTLGSYGGTYSADCHNPNAPRLRVLANELAIEEGPRRVVGRNPRAQREGRGPNVPPEYQV